MVYHLSAPELYEISLRRNETKLSADGALVAYTGKFTGRAAKDKYIVRDESTENLVDWGKVNQPISAENYKKLRSKVIDVLEKSQGYAVEVSVGADPRYALEVEVHTEFAYHALFAKTLFREALTQKDPGNRLGKFRVMAAPSALANPEEDGTKSETFVVINFKEREIIIGGTRYAGEIKKSVFTVMNYLLPQAGVMTMHAAANLSADGSSAIFFGLSGTGKTTLSTDPDRKLIGDDEHGWCEDGVFNFEGGCYAKAIKLSPKAEPEIWARCHSFGTILENVEMDEKSRAIDFDSARITENTRAAYSLKSVSNSEPTGRGGHPTAVVMLTCDAFGVLPPVARLTPEQAMYYFLSGYTAKVAGTEAGITEPTSTFSACFGEPFMALAPTEYAKLLGEHLKNSGAACYLVNTGWWKGPYGKGERMPISMSRKIVSAAVSGELKNVPGVKDPVFGFEVPTQIEGVDSLHLQMENTWEDKEAYKAQATKLAGLFNENFRRYEGKISAEIRQAGPAV